MFSLLSKKILFLILSCVVAIIALTLIENLIYDRMSYQDEARKSVANSWSGEQQLLGPLLVVPYKYTETKTRTDEKSGNVLEELVTRFSKLYLVPEQLNVQSELTTQSRYRGIFSFPVYSTQFDLEGSFNTTAIKQLRQRSDVIWTGSPYLAVSVSDMRGIISQPEIQWNNEPLSFLSGSRLSFNNQGVHALIKENSGSSARFTVKIGLRGMDNLWFSPTGKNTQIAIAANWPHPNFVGKFLPDERHIEQNGFSAIWHVSEFSSNLLQDVNSCQQGDCNPLINNRFGFALNEPVNIYRQSIRAAKYGLLFVGLTFLSFFIFETLKRLQIHPVQYTLVGLSISLFYLLLIALSEHIGFVYAYLSATSACCLLLSVYISAMIRNRVWGISFGAMITLLYGMLYIIISSEDHALLLGSILVFLALAGVMLLTKNFDWHQVSQDAKKPVDFLQK